MQADECLKCHTTAHGVDEKRLGRRYDGKGVQCEACHGPGETHQKARMKAAMEGGEPTYEGVPATEIDANPSNETCAKCQNPESPSFKPFCFSEGRAKIQHLNLLKKRTDEKKAALFACPCGDGGKCPHPDGCPGGKCGPKPVKSFSDEASSVGDVPAPSAAPPCRAPPRPRPRRVVRPQPLDRSDTDDPRPAPPLRRAPDRGADP